VQIVSKTNLVWWIDDVSYVVNRRVQIVSKTNLVWWIDLRAEASVFA
jgi:hypothetical protein